MTVHLIALAGSIRKDSYNKKLVKSAAQLAEEAGAKVTFIDMADYPLPLYDGDLEESQGLPENALKLKKIFTEGDGFIFASPEYNSAISGPFKNLIDWVSRPERDEPGTLPFQKKLALLLSASPGALGGLRGLVSLRSILGNIGVLVLPQQVTVRQAFEAFDESGALKDEKKTKQLKEAVLPLLQVGKFVI